VAGGFMCPLDFDFGVFAPYLDDSKKMTESEREEIFGRIEKVMESNICRYHFAYRESYEIDKIWIREANRQCMQEVILGLLQYTSDSDTIYISIDGCDNYDFDIDGFEYIFAKKRKKDGEKNEDNFCHAVGIPFPCDYERQPLPYAKDEPKSNFPPSLGMKKGTNTITYLIGGDTLSPAISAASVVAKVTRDRMMCDFHEDFPEYGFASHKGYGTRKHREAMIHYGITPIHRKSYAPVKSLILGETSI
jgi:ribonuclease HII